MKKNAQTTKTELITLPVIPTIDVVVFPHMVVPLLILDPKIVNGVSQAVEGDKQVLLLTTKPQGDDYDAENAEPISVDDLYAIGTICEVIRVMELPDGGIKILIQGKVKGMAHNLYPTDELLTADVQVLPLNQESLSQEKMAVYRKKIISLIERLPAHNTTFSSDFSTILAQVDEAHKICDFILSHLNLPTELAQQLLEEESMEAMFEQIALQLEGIITSSEVEEQIRNSTRESINKSQREYYLREQLRTIQKELGDDSESDIADFEKKAATLTLSEEARGEVRRQIGRLKKTASDSLEATVLRNHVEWLLSMPWGNETTDSNDIVKAQQILDEQHYGLEEVKERILDYLSVKYLKNDCDSPILCLTGAPGVGKTSLGKSIAQCMGRSFARLALGGVQDEAEIRGHRRTYVGALPGRFVQAIKKAGSLNPVILLDEIDKIGSSHKGDPSAALLEALDPEQNGAFYDNYLGVHFDFSKVLFITTANDLSTIPGPLRDRMEIIHVAGYTQEEKLEIAKRHLAPRIIKNSGLGSTPLVFSDEVLHEIIVGYTREAGVRTLGKVLQKLCAKYARAYISTKKGILFTKENITQHLGPRKVPSDELLGKNKIGITNGLAWTPYGGEVLQVEAILMPGKGKFTLTGQLGSVMKESAQAAVSYARSHADKFGIDAKMFTDYDLHIHLPAGSIPKDGPSAGVTLLSSIFSVYTGRSIDGNFAMTGEMNLQGQVLAIGGVKEKLLAAKQRGLNRVIFPKQNEKDIRSIKNLPSDVAILFVEDVEEVLNHVLLPK